MIMALNDESKIGLIHVRSYTRSGSRGVIDVSAYDRSPPGGGSSEGSGRAWEKQSNPGFRDAIARAERSGEHAHHGYRQYNSSGGGKGAFGRYQLRMDALTQAGWMNGLGRWTDKAGACGVKTDMDFLNHPEAQEAAMTDVLRDYDRQLSAKGLDQHIGKKYTGIDGRVVVITRAGLIAAGHREGMGATADYLRRRINGKKPRPEIKPKRFAHRKAS